MRRSSAPMAATTVADSTNAVEVADFLKEAVAAGTASEAVRSVLSSNEGAEFAELLVQQLGERSIRGLRRRGRRGKSVLVSIARRLKM